MPGFCIDGISQLDPHSRLTPEALAGATLPTVLLASMIAAGFPSGDSGNSERLRTELDALHADYLSRLGDYRRLPRGAAYSRFSTRFQEGIRTDVLTVDSLISF